MMNSSFQVPYLNCNSHNLPETWKKYENHAKLMSSGPLAEKTEIVQIYYLFIWVVEKSRDIRNA